MRILGGPRLGGLVAILGVMLSAATARAQTQIPPPTPYQVNDANGVNLATGTITIPIASISVGPDVGGLSDSVSYVTGETSNYRHSVVGGISRDTLTGAPAYQYTVTTPDGGYVFSSPNGLTDFTLREGRGGTLTRSGDIWTFTALEGSVYRFDTSKSSSIDSLASLGSLVSITRPSGEVITYTYSGVGYGNILQSVTNTYGYQLHFSYTGTTLNRVEAINNAVDRCAPTANTCTLTQDWPSLAFATNSVTDTLGRQTRLIPGSHSLGVARPTKTTGQNITIALNADTGKVSSVDDGAGTWSYDFGDPSDPPPVWTATTTVTDPLNHVQTALISWSPIYHLNEDLLRNRVMSSTDALGNTKSYAYTNGGSLRSTTMPEGDVYGWTYSSRGDPTGWIHTPKAGSPLSPVSITAAYADCSTPIRCGRPTAMTDQRGAVTDFTYDAAGNLLTVTSPAPTTGAARPQTRYAWQQKYAWFKQDGSSSITRADNPIWVQVEQSQCATGASCDGTATEVLTTTAYQAGSSSAASNLLPVSVSTGAGDGSLTATTATTYDAVRNTLTVNGPLSGSADTTRYVWDAMRQQVGVIGPDPDGAGARLYPATRTTYNADGQVISVAQGTTTGQTDAAWSAFSALRTDTTAYDAQGRKVRDTAASGTADAMVTQYGYDTTGRLSCTAVRMNPSAYGSLPASACTLGTAGSFGSDRITRNAYDAANRLLSVTSGYGVDPIVESQTWTDNGQVATRTDGGGHVSTYVYDGFDRVSRLRFPNASGGGSSTTDYENYTYDAADNVTAFRNRAGETISHRFDALNRETKVYGDEVLDLDKAYDNLGRLTHVQHTSATSTALDYEWDALGRKVSEDGPLGVIAWGYDLAGRRTKITWPDGFGVDYAYTLDDQVSAIRENGATSGAGVLASYAYDNLGRRTGITRGNGVTTSYGYDAASRLTSLGHDLPSSADDISWTYAYNPAGQMIERTTSNAAYNYTPANGSTSYANNGKNQVTAAGGAAISYDANQNIINDGTNSYVYDVFNRLTAVTGVATYRYDPLGRLYQQSFSNDLRLMYEGDQPIGEVDLAGAYSHRFVPGPNADERAAWRSSSGTRYWPITDERGSVVANLYTSGAILTKKMSYDEYGQGAPTQIFGYTGQMRLYDTSLYHYKARTYAPALGRFLQTDPVGYEAGLNLYAYVGNDPVNRTDPSGMLPYPGRPDSDGCVVGCDYSGGVQQIVAPVLSGGGQTDPIPGSDPNARGTAILPDNAIPSQLSPYEQANLDPANLTGRYLPDTAERVVIAGTATLIIQGRTSRILRPHPYLNRPDRYTGAQLPVAPGRRYTTYSVPGTDWLSNLVNSRRIVVSNDGLWFYTNTHYRGFQELRFGPSIRTR